MPRIDVIFYQKTSGRVPFLEGFETIPKVAQAGTIAKIKYLQREGRDAKRPMVAYLGDKIYEIRVQVQRNEYRTLFFYWEGKAVLSHIFMKKTDDVPRDEKKRAIKHMKNMGDIAPKEIDLAVAQMTEFLSDPDRFTGGGE
jgi:phage-related protein